MKPDLTRPALRRIVLTGIVSFAVPLLASHASGHGAETPPTVEKVQRRLAAQALPWVPNAGQWDAQAAWRAQSFAGTVWVTQDGILLHQFNGPRSPDCDEALRNRSTVQPEHAPRRACPRSGGWVLAERFVGGRVGAVVGKEPLEGRVSYFVGEAARHAADLPTHAALDLGEVFPGVTVELRATQANVEKLFTVAPGRDARAIRMRLEGSPSVRVTGDGALEAQTDHGPLRFTAPVAFQFDARNERREVPVRYVLARSVCGPYCHEYGFAVGPYDRNRPLTIDPLLQSTFLGGGGDDRAAAVAIHPLSGEVYVTGHAQSNPFPGTTGGAQPGFGGGGNDAFIARFNAALTSRLQTTYQGGTDFDEAQVIAIHPVTGEVYIAGRTLSSNFPGTAGGAQPSGVGMGDGFVARFNAALTSRLQATYVASALTDEVWALAVHPLSQEIYVAGFTASASFPGVPGGAQATFGGGAYDAFVSRFNAALTVRHQSTYVGGSVSEYGLSLAIHPDTGEVYVGGATDSNALPGVAGGAQSAYGGSGDGFVTRLNAALTERLQSTYLGGSGFDEVRYLAVHPASGNVYAAGNTSSTAFPGAIGGAQSSYGGGGYDTFVTRLNAELSTRLQLTYVGGSGTDMNGGLVIHPVSGEIYVSGRTDSTNLPGTTGGAQASYGGGLADAFVARFNAALTARLQATYFGDTQFDAGMALAAHPATGEIYVAGYTTSTVLPGTTGGAQPAFGGGVADAFVSRLSLDLRAADVVPDPFVLPAQLGVLPANLRTVGPVRITGLAALATISVDGALGSEVCVSTANACSCNASPGGVFGPTGSIADNQYLCVRHVSAPTVDTWAESRVVVGGYATKFRTLTGSLPACDLDMDGDGQVTAPKEGLVIARALLGFTPANAVVGTGISLAQWNAKRAALAACGLNF